MRIIGFSNAVASPFWITPVQALAPWLCRIKESLAHLTDFSEFQRGLQPEVNHLLRKADMKPAAISKTPASNDPLFTISPPADRQQPATLLQPVQSHALRVVLESDKGLKADCAGRMVMSGKIADICAELDRMEQRAARTGG